MEMITGEKKVRESHRCQQLSDSYIRVRVSPSRQNGQPAGHVEMTSMGGEDSKALHVAERCAIKIFTAAPVATPRQTFWIVGE